MNMCEYLCSCCFFKSYVDSSDNEYDSSKTESVKTPNHLEPSCSQNEQSNKRGGLFPYNSDEFDSSEEGEHIIMCKVLPTICECCYSSSD